MDMQTRATSVSNKGPACPSIDFGESVTTPKTDRRMTERFDVLGSLWGVLEIPETAAVVNSSETGMLVESTACPVLDAVQVARVDIDGVVTAVQSAVRHVRPVEHGKYLVGLEFVKPPSLAAWPAADGARLSDGRVDTPVAPVSDEPES